MKILAIASSGGHWIQLLRLKSSFEGHELVFASTNAGNADMVKDHLFYKIPDTNRSNYFSLFSAIYFLLKFLLKIKPNVIITTGAAPGLLAIAIGRFLGAKTIWVDSIANVETISMSGKIATKIANRVYTQWPELETSKILYKGNVL